MITARKIELLAPAKNAEFGMEAILHGADAVYIGAPKFSARASAGNMLDDIRQLTRFAHQFNAKVYVALNTILSNEELSETETLIKQLYEVEADALIIQDMGILQLDLPPIPLHASTQMDNRSVEKAVFLEKAGFSQLVLARELNIDQIAQISSSVDIPLEVFIHGALCVSYSGQCYLSNALTGRSANRGTCSQPCRLPYDLKDSNGELISSNKHFLSMKDLNQSANLEEILDAGVSSLKIEGRLKDLSYVKNTVAYYRQKLDELFLKRPEFVRPSSGKSIYTFTPDLQKSFNRGFTDYFLHQRKDKVWSPDTPKSIGEFVGTVTEVTTKYIRIQTKLKLHNGDGLCFMNHKKQLDGIQVNRVEGDLIFPPQVPTIKKGTTIYRNNDHEFEKTLAKKSAERKISVHATLEESSEGFVIRMEDEDGYSAELSYDMVKQKALKDQSENLRNYLNKTGQTIFSVNSTEILFSENLFIPASSLAQWRREITDKLLQTRLENYPRQTVEHTQTNHPFPTREISYLGNVANDKAKEFYALHQSEVKQMAFETEKLENVPLMYTRHCIKHSMEWCPKDHRKESPYKEPFFLTRENVKLRIEFDCKKCEMKIHKES